MLIIGNGEYHKQEKIHWAKHLRFQPYEAFHGNTLVITWPAVFIIEL